MFLMYLYSKHSSFKTITVKLVYCMCFLRCTAQTPKLNRTTSLHSIVIVYMWINTETTPDTYSPNLAVQSQL